MQTNLIPFPRLHFLITSFAPLRSAKKKEKVKYQVATFSESAVDSQHFLMKCADFDAERDKYLAVSMFYRGWVRSRECSATVSWLKTNKKVSFVEWCMSFYPSIFSSIPLICTHSNNVRVGPTGFKLGFNDDHPMKMMEEDGIAQYKRAVTMLGNNTYISRFFTERVCKKYDRMYSQRAYVHCFVAEGMEEAEFVQARHDLGLLLNDYADVLSVQTTTDEESD